MKPHVVEDMKADSGSISNSQFGDLNDQERVIDRFIR